MNESKICTACKYDLPMDKFKQTKNGFTKQCISCCELKRKSKEKQKCVHKKEKSRCRICDGAEFCPHDKRKGNCNECNFSLRCKHGKVKYYCIECDGSKLCSHGAIPSKCKDKPCNTIIRCEHGKERTYCSLCLGGSLCTHGRRKSDCIPCVGSRVCPHQKFRSRCQICDPQGHLTEIVRSRVGDALKKNKKLHSQEYLGCSIEEFKEHIESQFEEGMTWGNHGKWHIDHIIPLKYKENGEEPTMEQTIERLHWSNTQPLWASENMAKGNRFIGRK